MLNFRVLWTMNLSNIKVLTKWDSKVPIANALS
jgi:hypothetical protein